nr:hypothetical protein [Curtanaerobium respiraculi]
MMVNWYIHCVASPTAKADSRLTGSSTTSRESRTSDPYPKFHSHKANCSPCPCNRESQALRSHSPSYMKKG